MSSVLARYETFLLNNVSAISSLESSLRSVTWVLPGRFKDAELASEALAALLNTTSLYHDTLLNRIMQSDPKYRPLIPSSPHSRYTRAWAKKDSRYKWFSRTLEVLRYLELLIEMGLRRKASNRARWRVVILIEFLKATLRFALLRITRRPLVDPPVPERDFDIGSLPPPSNSSSPTLAPSSPSSSPPQTPDHLKNNHVPLPPHHLLVPPPPPTTAASPVDDFLLPKALSTSSVKAPFALVKPLSSPRDWLVESLYILRPLIYVIMLSRDHNTNSPLVTSIALDMISRNLRRKTSASSSLERLEYARRDRDIMWYLFRGAIWRNFTRPKLDAVGNRIANIPLLGIASAFLKDWMPLIDEYYYYTSS